ncbi:hypothetical protein SAMN05192539_100910 [Paraburkholderia diazotrophica]|uniref:Uncharacterized protein n=1 Tax=Paraburkholderia diazotrophica TaxID=667676 RepID=A0A1H6XMF3_9BURK|nr:hypothetical protein SAMN05192539_100910 [Paraburkholderia diazotrophica]
MPYVSFVVANDDALTDKRNERLAWRRSAWL